MEKVIKVLILLISVVSILTASEITFKDLTKLASEDLGKNIYLDKNVANYSVDFNIVDHQKKGEIYEFYKIVLFNNDLFLQYNKRGDFYFIKDKPTIIEPMIEPVMADWQELHYYSYKIKNITNKDVVNCMSIFPKVKFVHLAQSDMIAYSATKKQHVQVKKMLHRSDNSVRAAVVKITLFASKKDNLLSYGSNVRAFNLTLDGTITKILSSLKNGDSKSYNLNNTANLAFTLFALDAHGLVDIFQEPTLRLTNGIETSVSSVLNVGYKESTTTYTDAQKNVTENLKYRDIGLTIKVLPKIKSNWVYLDLNLVSEDLLSLDDKVPLTQKITYKSSVKVTKGKPILLTGIRKTSKKYERDGVPILSDIPYLGELFKKQTTKDEDSNINILIEVL